MNDYMKRMTSAYGDLYDYIDFSSLEGWECYSEQLDDEYRQSTEEGKDIEHLKPLFEAVRALPKGPEKSRMADEIFKLIAKAGTREGYPYVEPDEIDAIFAERPADKVIEKRAIPADIKDKLTGAWYGRICGCLAGKPVEGCNEEDLTPFLKASNNYPMHRYMLSTDVPADAKDKYKFWFTNAGLTYADRVSCAPVDDDTNYTVLYQQLVKSCGRGFTPRNVAGLWMSRQPKSAYCTAERVAIRNFVAGLMPPASAVYHNPYREWIGAQIRADYFGYINPGDPEAAAEMAWRDASVSHVKNGIYGEMFVAAMIAAAAVEDDIITIIKAGLAQIPERSRLYEAVTNEITAYQNGVTQEEAFAKIHAEWDEHFSHYWCHTISNALIVVAALLYSGGDYTKAVGMAVQTGFDTDCNGATTGSILGMRNGSKGVGEEWKAPLNGIQDTTITGVGKVTIESLIETTLSHLPKD